MGYASRKLSAGLDKNVRRQP